jgi:hypothetical protein
VPFLYKHAVDTLGGKYGLVVVPVTLIVAYGMARVCAQGFNELRDAVFAKVEQRAIRRLALSTFRHLHSLSLRFHLDRRTGGLARAVERGTQAVDFLLTFILFNIVPTVIEILSSAASCGGSTIGNSPRSPSRRSSSISASPSR